MKIELGKIYVDTAGAKWRVASVTGPKDYPVIAVNDDEYGSIKAYGLDGKLDGCDNHLVSEYNAWQDVKVDTPIWVRNSPTNGWWPRHFAGLSDGKIFAWTNGATSHSIGDRPHPATDWAEATLQRPESLLADEQA